MRNLQLGWRRLLSFFIILALVLGINIVNVHQVAGNANANFIYVATTGSDITGNGTSGNPYKTIRKAASVVTPGTTVLVRAGTYIEENIRPNVSGTDDAMIVFRPETASDMGKVIIKHNDIFTGSTVTQAVKDQWLKDTGWTAAQTRHYTNADIEYSIAGRANQTTDVFNLTQRNYIHIEGFVFRDYKYARSTININNGHGNVVINNQFINIGTVHSTPWHWTMNGADRGDVTININGNNNVIRNNYFQSVIGETTSYAGNSSGNIITENTFIGDIGKNGDHSGSESSTLGARFAGNKDNAFTFNYSGGSVNGGTIWLDIEVTDFTALRNVSHNTAYFIFNESGCERNWIYENITYNKPVDANKRMPADPKYFTDFPAQTINSAYFTAFWDTGSTFDARWVNNVTYNVREGINLERSWRDEVRNNISYEDANSSHNVRDTTGLRIFETAVIGYHRLHGYDLKGGGPQIIRNNLWFSTRKSDYVQYMRPSQPMITVADFNAQINANDLGVDPMFENPAAYDFRLKSGSPAIGSGDNGVDLGAYAVYPKIDVGYNENLSLLEDVNLSFGELNSSVRPGDIVNLEVKLNKPATKSMSFEIAPVAGDARVGTDFRFLNNSNNVTFAAGERTKTVRIEILQNTHDLDQLLALNIQPTGSTKLEEVGPRNLHLLKLRRVTKFSVLINGVGDSLGRTIVEYYEPGETVTVDAKTRSGCVFAGWASYHGIGVTMANKNNARTTFVMPDYNVALRADWNLTNGTPAPWGGEAIPWGWSSTGVDVAVTGISLNRTTLALSAETPNATLTATIQPNNATVKGVIWTSSNPLVATVDHNGVVTAVSSGTATIIAKSVDRHREARCTVTVIGTYKPITPAVMRTDGFYTIRNQNSNRYLDVEDNVISAGSNVVQGETNHNFTPKTMWKLKDADNGYYYLLSAANETFALDVFGENIEDGTNVNLWQYTGGTNQQYKFVKVSEGVYTIRTRVTNDTSCVEVEAASLAAGGNVLQWVVNGGSNQNWIMEWHDMTSITTPGDVNGDGKVDILDVRLLKEYLLGIKTTLPKPENADLDNDGVLTILDLAIQKQIILKRIFTD